MSRTCRKFLGIFYQSFEHIEVQTTRNSIEIAKKQRKTQETQTKAQAQREGGSWIHREATEAVGLIHLDQTLDLMARMQGQVNQD
jgi:hypothetical protein